MATSAVVANRGTVSSTSGLVLDATQCTAQLSIFQPASTVIGSGATLTMSDGATYAATSVQGGVGTLGNATALTGTTVVPNVVMPNGGSAIPPVPYTGPRPTRLCA